MYFKLVSVTLLGPLLVFLTQLVCNFQLSCCELLRDHRESQHACC